MGGSLKGKTMAKRTTKKAAAKTAERGMDPQSGMDPGPTPAEATKAAEDKFAAADAKGEPKAAKAAREAEEVRVGLQVRGY